MSYTDGGFGDPAVVYLDPNIDPEKPMISEKHKEAEPHFGVSETARVLFGRSKEWLRKHERDGHFMLDGKPVEVRRLPSGARYYTLWDVEQLAHALAQGGYISGQHLRYTITIVVFVAKLYHY